LSKVKVIKTILWILIIVTSLMTIYFAYEMSIYQSLYTFIFFSYVYSFYRKCLFYKDIGGSELFNYTETLKIMKATSYKKEYKGFDSWSSISNLSELAEVITNESKNKRREPYSH
jgi:hypothetical protein